jgi:hypothetical protein
MQWQFTFDCNMAGPYHSILSLPNALTGRVETLDTLCFTGNTGVQYGGMRLNFLSVKFSHCRNERGRQEWTSTQDLVCRSGNS